MYYVLLTVIVWSLISVLSLAIITKVQIGPSYPPQILILCKGQQPIIQSTCPPKGCYRSLIVVTQVQNINDNNPIIIL